MMTATVQAGVIIASPGGLAGQGGMASVTKVMAAWFKYTQPNRRVFIVDPRGKGTALLWPLFFIAAAIQIVALRAAGQVHILHLQVSERSSFIRKGLLCLLGKSLGMTVVIHHHGAELIPFFQSTSWLMRHWTRFVIGRAGANVVLGERWRTFLESEVGVDVDRIKILYNAVPDYSNQPTTARSFLTRTNKSSATFRLLFLAQLVPRKGVGELLLALRRLQADGLSVHATLAGGGDLPRYKEEARKLGILDSCDFVGWVDRNYVRRLLQNSDALVLPSFDEGLPMSILEALSSGLPVIATPVGSIGEVLTSRIDCLLVQPADFESIVLAVKELAENRMFRCRLSSNGRELYERLFTVDVFMSKLLDIYRSAAPGPE
jgi:glycosyltransferase involved in cell wall biosynthesis